jgi:5-methylcytosine-specific restriction protein A
MRAPVRYCTGSRTCPHKAGACPVHRSTPYRDWTNTPYTTARLGGRKLQRLRAQLFDREPFCRCCLAHGNIRLADIRDHIVPLAEGGTDDDANIQPLCKECSALKTQQEAQRGQHRQANRR